MLMAFLAVRGWRGHFGKHECQWGPGQHRARAERSECTTDPALWCSAWNISSIRSLRLRPTIPCFTAVRYAAYLVTGETHPYNARGGYFERISPWPTGTCPTTCESNHLWRWRVGSLRPPRRCAVLCDPPAAAAL